VYTSLEPLILHGHEANWNAVVMTLCPDNAEVGNFWFSHDGTKVFLEYDLYRWPEPTNIGLEIWDIQTSALVKCVATGTHRFRWLLKDGRFIAVDGSGSTLQFWSVDPVQPIGEPQFCGGHHLHLSMDET
jgi:hypothetical protein